MKSKVTNLIKAVVFLIIGVVFFAIVQQIFIPAASQKRENADRTIDGLGKIEQGIVDVIFIGPSNTEYGVSPIHLYKNTGICGYSLATSGQPIGVAYWLLKDAFTKSNPSLIFLQAGQLFELPNIDQNTVRWGHILENYPLSPFKFEMAKDYDTVPYGNGMMSALFPIIKYHTRWTELTDDDFDLRYGGEYYSLGEFVNGMVTGNTFTTYESNDKMADFLQQDTYITERVEGKTTSETLIPSFVSRQITDYATQSYLKIKELCDENNAELVLYQIPKNISPQVGGEWTREMSNQVREFAQDYDLKFFDLQYDTDVGLNWATDTCDAGTHLNIRGAEKVSDAIGKYLLNNFSVRQQSNPQYDGYAAKYDKIRDVAMLQSETDLQEYLNRISEKRNQWSVFISASDEYTAGMKPEVYDKFENLGLPLIREGKFRDAYVGVLDRGEAKYEAVSGRRIEYEANLDGISLQLSSAGWYAGSGCTININGRNYAIGGRGLNIVVYDNESGMVIDSVRFDTCSAENTSYLNNGYSNEFLRAYEKKICF